jgi:hypothetical protein
VTKPTVPLIVSIPADIDPVERGERFATPINRALWYAGRLGRVSGGGTEMRLGGKRFVTGVYLHMDVKDVGRALPVARRALLDIGVPRGTRVINCDTEEVLLVAPRAGELRPPARQPSRPDYPWNEGEILGYRLSPEVVALLYVIAGGRHPLLRVLEWSGPVVPPLATVRKLLDRRERTYALGKRCYMVGWQPVGMRIVPPRQLGRADKRRLERPGLVVPFRDRYLRGRHAAFDTWPHFEKMLRQLTGLEPMTAPERLSYELGVGTLAHSFAVWSAAGPLTADEAYRLYAAYVPRDRDRPAVKSTPALRRFVRDFRKHYAAAANGEVPWVNPFRAAEGFMILAIKKFRADEVRGVIRELARRHGLTAYDSQRDEVYISRGRPPS